MRTGRDTIVALGYRDGFQMGIISAILRFSRVVPEGRCRPAGMPIPAGHRRRPASIMAVTVLTKSARYPARPADAAD